MNNTARISKLYDQLFCIEGKYKKNYPIHKTLIGPSGKQNVYDYLLRNYIKKTKGGGFQILDAGCGVGFGSLLIASKTNHIIKGISISKLEIEQAISNVRKLNLSNCSFLQMNFDNIKPNKYDIIFCVESIKHTINFTKTYKVLLKGLKPQGKLIIVDDFYEPNFSTNLSHQLIKNWELSFLLKESDLEGTNLNIEKEDITHFISKKNSFTIQFRKCLIGLCSLFKNSYYRKLFLGGIQLEQLYANNLMKYKIIQIRKK